MTLVGSSIAAGALGAGAGGAGGRGGSLPFLFLMLLRVGYVQMTRFCEYLRFSKASISLTFPFFFAIRLALCKFFASRSFLVNSEWFAKWFTFRALTFPASTDDAIFPPPPFPPPREYEMF